MLLRSSLLQREVVDSVMRGEVSGPDAPQYPILCDDLRKVYPGRDGNPAKTAVKSMSLAVAKGECFGMLGPNGAGKSTSISMVRHSSLGAEPPLSSDPRIPALVSRICTGLGTAGLNTAGLSTADPSTVV